MTCAGAAHLREAAEVAGDADMAAALDMLAAAMEQCRRFWWGRIRDEALRDLLQEWHEGEIPDDVEAAGGWVRWRER